MDNIDETTIVFKKTPGSEDAPIDELFFINSPEFNKDISAAENSTQVEISELSKQAYSLLKGNSIKEAINVFKKILELDPANNYALVGLGDAERKNNKFNDAIKFYKQCLEHHPSNNYALFGLADCYKSMNQFPKAIAIWEEYLKFDDKNITVLTRVADAYRKTKEFEKAEQLYLKVLEKSPKNAYALIGLGHLNYDFKKYREALVYWEKVMESSGEFVDIRILTSIGNCYRKMKLFDRGVYYFERALERSPDNFYGLFGLADCYRGLNQQYNSIVYWKKILELDPNNKVILTRVGDAYRSMNDFEKAKECYQKALDIDFDSYAMLGLAILCKLQQKYDQAITTLTHLKNTEDTNYRVYLELAQCYIEKKEKQKAIDTLIDFQKLGIKNQTISDLLFELTKNDH
ncbi:tetratricopeptide repeat protein [Treponema putidum]|uniref:Tetratricopeptide repeat protein n=1 Tax=Treponema putidum TaxID=221027 RepID=A0AAE9MTL5_9SPIR|nr:tetratricopeptide repeat protein [Treponema putidum]TWI76970.1 Tfp pilus assembly protein PilF [Treponema putidum]UTY27948.1 tetratricopeptide repeat protein [Treponema putidum]UTY30391.1 tetratricopeptide repeat protein [Treponema putidum]UTY32863.1 tetratricopeptide repeat protein [Treponema putidum]